MDTLIRHMDRVEADVDCLMCGRLIGQLFGMRWREPSGRRAGRTISNLTTFRYADTGEQSLRVNAHSRFWCPSCGGFGIVGEVSRSVLFEQVPEQACPVHGERKTGPGRPPKGCRCHAQRAAA